MDGWVDPWTVPLFDQDQPPARIVTPPHTNFEVRPTSGRRQKSDDPSTMYILAETLQGRRYCFYWASRGGSL